jgi:uncharacterized protein (TIGR00255 family)
MTAYGRATRATSLATWVVEIHTVNRKFLDIHVILPKEFLRFDLDVRRWISEAMFRGQVTVRIALQIEDVVAHTFQSSLKVLKNLKETWEKIAGDLGYDPKESVTFPFLTAQLPTAVSHDIVAFEDEQRQALKEAIHAALEEVMQMKQREGKSIEQDILMRLEIIEGDCAKVEKLSSSAPTYYRTKLQERIQELGQLKKEDEDRILREIVIFAEKTDITEELTRLRSHILQFRHYLEVEEKSIGKTLEFLTQEMNREMNTLAAKSADSEIAHSSINMKSELEKIREQVQNIE